MEIRHFTQLPVIVGTLEGRPYHRMVRTVTECTNYIKTPFGTNNMGWVRFGPWVDQYFCSVTGKWK